MGDYSKLKCKFLKKEENREQVLVSLSPSLGRVFGVSEDVIERRLNEERDLWI